jgi:dienelactone hydrolase
MSIETRVGRVAALRSAPARTVPDGPAPGAGDAGEASSRSTSVPGVLVVHDAWGLDDELADLVAALGGAGFVALAPDVVAGRLAGDADEAVAVAAGIDAEDATLVLAAAVDVLAADRVVRGGPLGAVGLGIGAPLAAFLATIRPEIGILVMAGPVPTLSLEAWARSDADVVVLAEPGDGDAAPADDRARDADDDRDRDDDRARDADDDRDADADAASLDRAVAAGRRVERVEVRLGEDRARVIADALLERLRP